MSDIFISYSSADRPRAAIMAQALAARGWSIWWDRTIPPGRQFDDVIEEALDAAGCVVVLWSTASAASSWVRNEASSALQRKALIPALIEADVKIPLEFRRLQAADLTRWNGDAATPEFEQFCDAIAAEVGHGGAAGSAPAPSAPVAAKAPSSPQRWTPVPAPPPVAASSVSPAASVAATATVRSKTPYLVGGAVLLFLVVAGALSNSTHTDLPATAAASGIHADLRWRDYVLAYSGQVSWDGRSSTAFIQATVADSNTQQVIGNRELTAAVMRTGPQQIVLSTSVAVPGDSRTPGPHSHNVNLVFENQGGTWQFMRNCMAPDNCY